MPTVLRSGPYRFFFYANDREEPCHVHVERDENTAEYWLDPVRLQSSTGFNRLELRKIGSTRGGRYLRVIYVPDPEPDSIFVITAYELTGKPLKAYRRRSRRRQN